MEMIFCPLYSGSSGNCLFVQYGATRLLIDAGKSGKMIDEALDMIGVDGNTIDAILITHEHIDHISGAGDSASRRRRTSAIFRAASATRWRAAPWYCWKATMTPICSATTTTIMSA